MKKLIGITYIVLIGILLTTSAITVAWFTGNDFLRIESIDLVYKSVDDLLISTSIDGEYTDELEIGDMQESGQFIPVSSVFSEDWIENKEKFPSFVDPLKAGDVVTPDVGNPYVSTTYVKETKGFYSQELFLKSSSDKNAVIVSDTLTTFIEADRTSNEDRAKELVEEDPSLGTVAHVKEQLDNIANSIRMSVLVDADNKYEYKIYDPHKDEDVYFGGIVDSDCSGVFDSRIDQANTEDRYEVLYGDVKNKENIVYNNKTELESKKTKPTWFDSGHSKSTYTIDLEESINAGVEIKKENSISLERNEELRKNLIDGHIADRSELDDLLLIPLKANVPTRIVLSVYLEGWDKDNIDATMGASFVGQVTFGIVDRNIA